MKTLFFDIESTGLNATFGTILCIGWKFLDDKKVTIGTILDGGRGTLDDRALVKEFAKHHDAADQIVTWYGKKFDVPMIQSKMLKYGLGPLAPKYHLDLWETAKYKFKFHSNRLAAVQEFLQTKDSKTPISFEAWLRAAQGDKKSLAEVVEHCRRDVLVLEQIYQHFKPWLREPATSLFGSDGKCPSCGSNHIQRRGYKVALTRVYQQYQCQDCQHWFRDAKATKISPQGRV